MLAPACRARNGWARKIQAALSVVRSRRFFANRARVEACGSVFLPYFDRCDTRVKAACCLDAVRGLRGVLLMQLTTQIPSSNRSF